jgi:hypothetical protein
MFQQALEAFHNLKRCRVMPLGISCCCGALLRDDPFHFISCQKFRRTANLQRHNHLVDCIIRTARRDGYRAEPEPLIEVSQQLDEKEMDDAEDQSDVGRATHRLQPDARLSSSKSVLLVDVSVINPTAQTYVRNAAIIPRSAADHRERAKVNKYATAVDIEEKSVFLPLVWEAFGAVGRQTRALLNQMATVANELRTSRSDRAFVKYASYVLSVALQEGNAFIIKEGLKRAPSGNKRRYPTTELRKFARASKGGESTTPQSMTSETGNFLSSLNVSERSEASHSVTASNDVVMHRDICETLHPTSMPNASEAPLPALAVNVTVPQREGMEMFHSESQPTVEESNPTLHSGSVLTVGETNQSVGLMTARNGMALQSETHEAVHIGEAAHPVVMSDAAELQRESNEAAQP